MTKRLTKSLIAAGLLAFGGAAQAATITFDDTSLGGDNIFDFDSISLLSFATSVTVEDTDLSGDLTGLNEFMEFSLTGTVSFNTESGTTQTPIDPTITGLNTEYQLFFDLTVSGMTSFAIGVDAFGNPQLAGVVSFENVSSLMEFYYDPDMAPGLQGGATLLSSDSLVGSNGCSVVSSSTVAAGDVLGSCLLTSDFSPIAGIFAHNGTDLNSLIGVTPLTVEFDINVDEFAPALSFIFPGGAGTSQTFSVQHDGSARILVPEPAGIAILGLGLFAMGMVRRRS
ncbi:hypothetical protein GCM10009092_37620 [Bowmanella denitrificans]|uniref:PEP-CTERM protein-sorting domain-containing protein n=1 Tax=Bowmanella denitrificans TaxID=366582 RepID=A0ABP3HJC8_9ALTE